MDVFNIVAGVASKAPDKSVAPVREGSSRSKPATGSVSTEDVVSVSSRSAQVGQLAASLSAASIGDVRADFVEKFGALMNAGALDLSSSAERAASGLIDEI